VLYSIFQLKKNNASNYSRLSNLEIFLDETSELTNYLNNPVVNQNAKREVLSKTLESQVNAETFKFLMILVKRQNQCIRSSYCYLLRISL
jgi:F0F1-type ATP synthase delta subunit